MAVTFPNESPVYREHRNKLLQAEIDLREQTEAVAELRRAMPDGGELKEDYLFHSVDGAAVHLSGLFAQGQDTLAIYSLMFAETADGPCPMCSALLDALNGQMKHMSPNMRFVVIASASPEKLATLWADRGWDQLSLYSAQGTSYQSDYNAEAPDGSQLPILNIFKSDQDVIRHFWGSEMFFAPVGKHHPRHLDSIWPLWNILDLTPAGRGAFMPKLSYD